MEENGLENFQIDYSEISAFGNYEKVATSFIMGLEKSIISLVKEKQKVMMTDIIAIYGNYKKVHDCVKRLVLENKLILHEHEYHSIENERYDKQELRITRPEESEWIDLTAQPCLTCPIANECGIDNPVSPSTCAEFNTWLGEEIELLD